MLCVGLGGPAWCFFFAWKGRSPQNEEISRVSMQFPKREGPIEFLAQKLISGQSISFRWAWQKEKKPKLYFKSNRVSAAAQGLKVLSPRGVQRPPTPPGPIKRVLTFHTTKVKAFFSDTSGSAPCLARRRVRPALDGSHSPGGFDNEGHSGLLLLISKPN